MSRLRVSLRPWSVPHHFWGIEFRQQARPNWSTPSDAVERWKPFGVAGGRSRCRNDGSTVCWVSLVRRNVIAVGGRTMIGG